MTKPSLLLALLLSCWSLPARANDAAAAREHYMRASNAYDLGHFAEAAKEFEAAYELKNDAALLFNIGQAYRFDGKNQQALLAYRAYLRRLPEASNRVQVESTMRELQELIDKQKATESRPPTETLTPTENGGAAAVVAKSPPPKPQPVYKKWWLWTAVGGAVAIGLGVGLGVGLSGGSSNARTLPAVGGGL